MSESDREQGLRDLDVALAQVSGLIADIDGAASDRPTPCAGWSVGDLAGHLVASVGGLADMVAGRQPDWSAAADLSGGPAAAFEQSAQRLRDAFAAAPEGASTAMSCAEIAVHTWDLSTALGRPTDQLDPGPAVAGLAFMRENLTEDRRGDAFRPEQTAPDDADAYGRIAAFAGRTV